MWCVNVCYVCFPRFAFASWMRCHACTTALVMVPMNAQTTVRDACFVVMTWMQSTTSCAINLLKCTIKPSILSVSQYIKKICDPHVEQPPWNDPRVERPPYRATPALER